MHRNDINPDYNKMTKRELVELAQRLGGGAFLNNCEVCGKPLDKKSSWIVELIVNDDIFEPYDSQIFQDVCGKCAKKARITFDKE